MNVCTDAQGRLNEGVYEQGIPGGRCSGNKKLVVGLSLSAMYIRTR